MITPEQLTENLKTTLAQRLKSVVLYGSTVTGERTKHHSNVNLLVVVDQVDLDLLKKMQPVLKPWRKEKEPTPLIFSEETLQNSVDVFPLEFLDLQAANRVLTGVNPFAALKIDVRQLRHQLEFELRSKLLFLRQRYLEAEGNSQDLRTLMSRSLSSFTALLKGLMWLEGKSPPSGRLEIWKAAQQLAAIDVEVFEKILHIREDKPEAKSYDLDQLFGRLHETVSKLVRWVDQHN